MKSDRGKEFYEHNFRNFLKLKNIQHFSRYSDKGPAVAHDVEEPYVIC